MNNAMILTSLNTPGPLLQEGKKETLELQVLTRFNFHVIVPPLLNVGLGVFILKLWDYLTEVYSPKHNKRPYETASWGKGILIPYSSGIIPKERAGERYKIAVTLFIQTYSSLSSLHSVQVWEINLH